MSRNKNSFSKSARVFQFLKHLVFLGFIFSALFGLISAATLLLAPEKISNVTTSLSAFGSKGYKLPNPVEAPPNPEADVRVMKTFSKVFVNIGKATRPALVFIQTKMVQKNPGGGNFGFPDEFFFFPFQPPGGGRGNIQQGAGSGFIVDLNKGYVITNSHVVENADEIVVNTFDDRKFKGKKVGADKTTDVAVIKIEDFKPAGLKQVSFGDSDAVEVGDWAVALGAPFELPQTLTVGVVSATGRNKVTNPGQIEDFIQTDAAINPGNSGGPLLDIEGRVIGINTAILSRTGAYAGIGFSVPSNMAKMVAEMLINEGKVTRGYLGIGMSEINELSNESRQELHVGSDTHGVLVRDVFPGGPAEKAGLKPYDIIRTVNGAAITSGSQLRNKIAFTKPGNSVKLGLLRDGKSMDVTATIGVYNEEQANRAASGSRRSDNAPLATEFGLRLAALTPELRRQLGVQAKQGVVITAVDENSIAGSAMLMSGDVILEINRKTVKTVKDVENALKLGKDRGRDLLFLIERDGRSQIFNFRLR